MLALIALCLIFLPSKDLLGFIFDGKLVQFAKLGQDGLALAWCQEHVKLVAPNSGCRSPPHYAFVGVQGQLVAPHELHQRDSSTELGVVYGQHWGACFESNNRLVWPRLLRWAIGNLGGPNQALCPADSPDLGPPVVHATSIKLFVLLQQTTYSKHYLYYKRTYETTTAY